MFIHLKVKVLVAQSCPTVWEPVDVARQAPLSMGFSWQEYWSGLLFPTPRNLPIPGIKARSPTLQADYHLSQLPVTQRTKWLMTLSSPRMKCPEYLAQESIVGPWLKKTGKKKKRVAISLRDTAEYHNIRL